MLTGRYKIDPCHGPTVMSSCDPPKARISSAATGSHPLADERIGPNLRRAFPLPEKDAGSNERFQRLLDALALCGVGGTPEDRA